MKNLATHVVSGVIVLAVGFASGSAFHAQQVHNRQVAAQRVAAAQKAEKQAEQKAAADAAAKAAAQAKAQAAQKAPVGVTKVPATTTVR